MASDEEQILLDQESARTQVIPGLCTSSASSNPTTNMSCAIRRTSFRVPATEHKAYRNVSRPSHAHEAQTTCERSGVMRMGLTRFRGPIRVER